MTTTQAGDRAIEQKLLEGFFARHPGEAIRRLEAVTSEEAAELLSAQPLETTLAVWEGLSPDVGQAVLQRLPEERASDVLAGMEPMRAARLLAGLDAKTREAFLAHLRAGAAAEIRTVLSYPADRAGAYMDPRTRLFRPEMTVREIISRLRADQRPGRRGFFLVDSHNRLTGWVEMQSIALAGPSRTLGELAVPAVTYVDAMANRDEVVEKMEQYRLSELAVLDFDGRLIGVIRYDALLAAEKEQASVGIQTMVGVSKDERALSKFPFAVRKRLPWLQINLATAFLAAAVVGLFEETIASVTALAVLLPVVAGQSGNTGAQALAVTMRGLALREIGASHWRQVAWKELNVGLWNGIAVALTTALGVYLWSGSTGLTLIIGVSMVMSMVIASVAGAGIPIVLTLLKQDPAQSSSIVLTTVTDVAGFFSFLGIATLLLGAI